MIKATTHYLRAVKVEELAEFLPLAEEFFEASTLPGVFSERDWLSSWENMVEDNTGVIFGMFAGDEPVGAIGGCLCRDLNTGALIAAELFWYVTPSYRGEGMRLVRAFERWADLVRARYVRWCHLLTPDSERAHSFYKRRGYRPYEVSYYKDMSDG